MARRKGTNWTTIIVVAIAGFALFRFLGDGAVDFAGTGEPVAPDWTAITAWPGVDADKVDAQPDPNRVFTVIVLDDSGSMGSSIEAAKTAVISALDAMADDDRVAVVALNAGTILEFSAVSEARGVLPNVIARVGADGGTPLTAAVRSARGALAAEAARAGGFGTYRILVTTDGAADNGTALREEIEDIARVTPIQVATIGVGIGDRHVLSRPDLATFVSIADVSGLAAALQSAIAEEQSFTAITSFEGN